MKRTESVHHQNAKAIVARALSNREPIDVVRFCVRCQGGNQVLFDFGDAEILDLYEVLPEYHDVLIEYLLSNGRRADVCLFDKARNPVALIEVRNKKAVDSIKAGDLDALGVPWMEVTASDVVAGSGPASWQVWIALQDHLGSLYLCPDCRD